jgi:hypothetical protein
VENIPQIFGKLIGLNSSMRVNDWYVNTIEAPVRELVYFLRNNGFNTECSCGHEMYIQCQYIPEGTILQLHNLIYGYLYDNKLPITYTITTIVKVIDGIVYPTLRIDLDNTEA